MKNESNILVTRLAVISHKFGEVFRFFSICFGNSPKLGIHLHKVWSKFLTNVVIRIFEDYMNFDISLVEVVDIHLYSTIKRLKGAHRESRSSAPRT